MPDRSTLLNRAEGCAKIANEILSREHAIASGNRPAPSASNGKLEDREAVLDVASQYIELAKAFAHIAAACPGTIWEDPPAAARKAATPTDGPERVTA